MLSVLVLCPGALPPYKNSCSIVNDWSVITYEDAGSKNVYNGATMDVADVRKDLHVDEVNLQ